MKSMPYKSVHKWSHDIAFILAVQTSTKLKYFIYCLTMISNFGVLFCVSMDVCCTMYVFKLDDVISIWCYWFRWSGNWCCKQPSWTVARKTGKFLFAYEHLNKPHAVYTHARIYLYIYTVWCVYIIFVFVRMYIISPATPKHIPSIHSLQRCWVDLAVKERITSKNDREVQRTILFTFLLDYPSVCAVCHILLYIYEWLWWKLAGLAFMRCHLHCITHAIYMNIYNSGLLALIFTFQ